MRFFKDPDVEKGGGSPYAILREDGKVKYWFKHSGWDVWLNLGENAEADVKQFHTEEVSRLEVLAICGYWGDE